ncbi:MAG: hypothetical protein ACOZNI_20520, partial [Myxococcota bacterium]
GTGAIVVAAAIAGALVGAGAIAVADVPVVAPGEWVRGQGGWWKDGVAFPDPGAGEVGAPTASGGPGGAAIAGAAAAAALGATLGLVAGAPEALLAAAFVVVAEALARGLVERGAIVRAGLYAPAIFALAAAGWLRRR